MKPIPLPSRIIVLASCLPSFLSGCALSPIFLVERGAIEKRLPPGILMSDYVAKDLTGYKVTVAEKLARLGAHPGKDGKLYDALGRQIAFFEHYRGGTPPPFWNGAEEEKELAELRKRYTVIEISSDPDFPPL